MTGNSSVPDGQRFSLVYIARGEPTGDSARMRLRLASLVDNSDELGDLARQVEQELGVRLTYRPKGVDWDKFFASCELRDLLDFVTIAWRHLRAKVQRERFISSTAPDRWLQEVGRIFLEENIRYRLDRRGGIHFSIDEEFERNREASLSVLAAPRYSNVLNEFEEAYDHLSAVPVNGKGAVRATFTAAEGLFRLMFKDAPRLGAKEIDKYLAPVIQRMNLDDETAKRAMSKLLGSFKEWVDAAHFYRHEPGKEEIAQPPMPFAINLVSLGASFIRWLAEIDAPPE